MTKKMMRVLCFPKEGGNPYLNQLSSHLEAAGVEVDEFTFPRAFRRRYDVVHIHWPGTHLRSPSWWRSLGKHVRLGLLCAWLRLRRTRVVWTLHNLRAHEKDHWIGTWLFPRWFPRACTEVIALTPSGLELASQLYPVLRSKRAAIIPHGHYRDIFPPPPSREDCRRELGLPVEPFTMVYFGSIRRYKNVPRLVLTFRQLAGRNVQLLVAGEPVVGMRPGDIEAVAAGDPRVHLRLHHIADDDVPTFLGAADLVVSPFSAILNSGTVMLALSLNRPVLAPRTGALPDLEQVVGPQWLQLYQGELTPEVLAAGQDGLRIGAGDTLDLADFDWPAIAAATVDLYAGAPAPVAAPERAGTVPMTSGAGGS